MNRPQGTTHPQPYSSLSSTLPFPSRRPFWAFVCANRDPSTGVVAAAAEPVSTAAAAGVTSNDVQYQLVHEQARRHRQWQNDRSVLPLHAPPFSARCSQLTSLQQRQVRRLHRGVILNKVVSHSPVSPSSLSQNPLVRPRQIHTPRVHSPLTGRPRHGASHSRLASTPPISLPSAPEHQTSTTAHPHPKVMPQQPAPAPPSSNHSNNDYNNKCLDDSPHQETTRPTIYPAVHSVRTSSPRSEA